MLIVINIFLLCIGMVLESVATLILLTPILVPIARQVGIDPVHLGVLICLNVTLGAVHPPVGTLMFITCGVLDVRISDYTLAVLPLLAVQDRGACFAHSLSAACPDLAQLGFRGRPMTERSPACNGASKRRMSRW